LITITGSGSGMTSRVFAETPEEREKLIEAMGGEDECYRKGIKANTIRKNGHANAPGPASYWRAILLDDLTSLVRLTRNKGKSRLKAKHYELPLRKRLEDFNTTGWSALDTALAWGLPEEIINQIIQAVENPAPAGRPAGSGEDRCVTFRLMLTPEERVELNRLAEESGMTASQYVRSKIF